MKVLVLTYFDEIWGPKVYLKAPSSIENDEIDFIPELMDLEERGFFYHDLEGINTINHSFDIPREGARGGVESFMVSIVLINEDIKTKFFKPILNEFVEEFKEIEGVCRGINIRGRKEGFSEEKAREIHRFFEGFYKDLPEETVLIDKNVRIMVFGLMNAGKTTLVNKIQEIMYQHDFNRNKTAKRLFFNNLTMTTYDLPVKKTLGKLWNHYIQTQEGFIFMVDASNEDTHGLASIELHKVMEFVKTRKLPLAILFNKIDENKVPAEQLEKDFNLKHVKTKKIKSFSVSLIKNVGVIESFEWIANKILWKIVKNKNWGHEGGSS